MTMDWVVALVSLFAGLGLLCCIIDEAARRKDAVKAEALIVREKVPSESRPPVDVDKIIANFQSAAEDLELADACLEEIIETCDRAKELRIVAAHTGE
jgi:TolB-like protein